MQSVAEAEDLILQALPAPQTETIGLADAPGRVLAQDIVADRAQPPFDRVAMDGIAVSAADWEAGVRAFRLSGIQRAGQEALRWAGPGTAVEAMTGAQLPLGCDSVIQYEAIKLADGQATITGNPSWDFRAGMNVHRQGSDYGEGKPLLKAGRRIASAEIQVLATVGQATLKVYRQARVAIISTGDELVPVSQAPLPWQIRLSNSPSLAAEIALWGLQIPTEIRCGDNQAEVEAAIRRGLAEADVLIMTGGVSKGTFDCVPRMLEQSGVRQIFHHVRQKPGKPFWFGAHAGCKLVFALPGNPVAALTCCRRFVLPALAAMEGCGLKPVLLPLARDFAKESGNAWFPTARLVNSASGLRVEALPMLGSGNFFQLTGSAGFVELAADTDKYAEGSLVPFFAWGGRGLFNFA